MIWGGNQSTEKSSYKKTRNKSLDIIRALAIFLVLFNHLKPLSSDKSDIFHKSIRHFFYLLSTGGWIGVDLFFVLSGFLVSGLLFKEYQQKSSIDAKRFLIRRGFKIYPSFILFIGITFILDKIIFRSSFSFPSSAYIFDLIFVHNYVGGRWPHTWSLDVEEFFYFLLTGIFILYIKLRKFNFKTFLTTYLILLILAISTRLIANINHPAFDFDTHFAKTHFRLDALFFGVLLSYLYSFKNHALTLYLNKYKWFLIVTSVLFLLPNFFLPYWEFNIISIIFLSTNAICFGILLLISLNCNRSFFNNKFLSYIGKHSYNIYLWHVPLNFYLIKIYNAYNIAIPFNNNFYWITYAISYLVLSLLLGIFFTEVLEKPFITIRNKIYPA